MDIFRFNNYPFLSEYFEDVIHFLKICKTLKLSYLQKQKKTHTQMYIYIHLHTHTHTHMNLRYITSTLKLSMLNC